MALCDIISLAGKMNDMQGHLSNFTAQQVTFGCHIMLRHSISAFHAMCGKDYVCACVTISNPAYGFQRFNVTHFHKKILECGEHKVPLVERLIRFFSR